MSLWWSRHAKDFSGFSQMEKYKIEDLTGCIPLLLRPFLGHHGKTLSSLEPKIWNHELLESVVHQATQFGLAQLGKSKRYICHLVELGIPAHLIGSHRWYVEQMRLCLSFGYVPGDGSTLDHRYFYLDDEGRGRYTCGLARQAIMDLLRRCAEEGEFLDRQWIMALDAFKDNPSVTGFIVEQIVISSIASKGLRTGDIYLPATKIVTFAGDTPLLSRSEGHTLCVPVKSNLKTINAIYVTVRQKKKEATVIPIQITKADWRSDSEVTFFAQWKQWIEPLKGFNITPMFLWIVEDKRDRHDVEEAVLELKNRTILAWPEYTRCWVS